MANDDKGPPISAERQAILAHIDGKITRLRVAAETLVDSERETYTAQVLEGLRGEIRHELDLKD